MKYLIAGAVAVRAFAASDSSLVDAAYRDDVKTASSLVHSGVDANKPNRYGVTPLSQACTNGDIALVKLLLEAKADPNTALPGGETPLMTAARTG